MEQVQNQILLSYKKVCIHKVECLTGIKIQYATFTTIHRNIEVIIMQLLSQFFDE